MGEGIFDEHIDDYDVGELALSRSWGPPAAAVKLPSGICGTPMFSRVITRTK
jgi:hypothetical protein